MNRTLNNWWQINTKYKRCQYLAFLSVLANLILASATFLLLDPVPIVIIEKEGEKEYKVGNRGNFELTEGDIKTFVTQFIKSRYTWTEFNPQKTLQKLSCITSRGFHKKLASVLGKTKHDGKDKRVEQYAALIRPKLQDTHAIVSFDKVLRINGTPLATPTKLALAIVQGKRTHCNMKGLYINGLTEYQL